MKNLLFLLFTLASFTVGASNASFDEGTYPTNWIMIEKNGLYGFMDLEGEIIVKPTFDKIYAFDVYNPGWAKVERNGLFGFIDFTGEIVVKPKYDRVDPFGMYHANWALIEKNGLLGFIDVEGTVVVKPKYDTIDYTVIKMFW